MCRVNETFPQAVLDKIKAPPKRDYPIITPEDLTKYDGLLFSNQSERCYSTDI
jgi:NAD(P)H dehydrogenase (quinone)